MVYRIKVHPEYQAIFTEIDEDAEFFLRDTYEISTIYKVELFLFILLSFYS
jgi:hypothetical protein